MTSSEPLTVQRLQIELYVRWLQEVRRFRPATVSRRLSVVAGFYRTCVIDGVLEHSPTDHVRRPDMPPESPTLGLSHLQCEALPETGPCRPILRNTRRTRMDRHAAARHPHSLAAQAIVRLPRMHPHMLRHTFVTTMLDAGLDLRDVQIASCHADPRTTMRYDLTRHPNYILAAHMASGT